jgi:predicted Zn-dependent protease with MMP-like domain
MTRGEFEKRVVQALKRLPKYFRDRMSNVEVVIEGASPDGETLGLYEGVPLSERTHEYGMVLPDKITLYQKDIEDACREEGLELDEEIRRTVQHEIAHHFGMTDEHLDETGNY